MAIRTIRKEGDPVLRKVSKPIEVIDDKIRTIVLDMIETMYDADGVGLAAPQIGILKRIVVIDIYDDTGVKVLINPEIILQEGEQFGIEGCLSVPDTSGDVRRPSHVIAKGLDLEGREIQIEGYDLLARAICHELDHLEGVLYIDKVESE